MLTQVGAITTNGVQQQAFAAGSAFGTPAAFGINAASIQNPPAVGSPIPAGESVTVFSKNYANPRIYGLNVAYEQQIGQYVSAYAIYDWSTGVHLTRFEDPNSALTAASIPANLNSDTVNYTGTAKFSNLGSITNTTSDARCIAASRSARRPVSRRSFRWKRITPIRRTGTTTRTNATRSPSATPISTIWRPNTRHRTGMSGTSSTFTRMENCHSALPETRECRGIPRSQLPTT